MNNEIETLRTQLAKANERVATLEKERDHSQRMYNSLLGDLSIGYGESSISECEKHLNKFAIDNQIKAVEYCYKRIPDLPDSVYVKLTRRAEQLRKEQG